MLAKKLAGKTIILASGSPRRQAFFTDLGLKFDIRLKPVKEIYPDTLRGEEISDFLAKLKAEPFAGSLSKSDILVTSDTVVWFQNTSLTKPKDATEARWMLNQLSNQWHEVITSVCFTTVKNQKIVNQTTSVKFKSLSPVEIDYYITHCNPFDKAGGYGIQEWIGLIAVEELKGSYTNVMGLPTQLVYKTLMSMAN